MCVKCTPSQRTAAMLCYELVQTLDSLNIRLHQFRCICFHLFRSFKILHQIFTNMKWDHSKKQKPTQIASNFKSSPYFFRIPSSDLIYLDR